MCYLPFDIGTCAAKLFEGSSAVDPNIKALIPLGYLNPTNPNEYYTTVSDNIVDFGKIFQKRRVLNCYSVVYFEKYNGYGTFDDWSFIKLLTIDELPLSVFVQIIYIITTTHPLL